MSLGKILIVEDDELSAQMLQRVIENLGYQYCGPARHSEEALHLYVTEVPDLVIMDFTLEDDVDGGELSEMMKEKFIRPIVFVTAADDDETISKTLATEPEGFVKKPFEERELSVVIEMALLKHQQKKALETMNSRLKERVEERTEELDIAVKTLVREMAEKEKLLEQLQEALEAEKEFGEMKTSIISNLSHEFKTPLTSIRSSAQLLQRMIEQNKMNEFSIKHTSRIQAAVSMLNDLLSRILLVEKREQPEIYTPQPETFDIAEFIEKIKEEITINNCNRAVIHYKEEFDVRNVYCDQKLLRLIITNLVSNACKFSPQDGRVDVTVKTSKRVLSIRVEDEGIGMSKEDMDQIFYRFYRGHNVGSIEGTGIGMSIMKRALDALDGEVSIDSELNKGTTFQVNIPLPSEK